MRSEFRERLLLAFRLLPLPLFWLLLWQVGIFRPLENMAMDLRFRYRGEIPGKAPLAYVNLDPLVRDLIEWIGPGERSYRDVMDAWRTSCPRLTVWEDAVELGLVERSAHAGAAVVRLTHKGRAALAS